MARGSKSSPWSDDGVIREDSADDRRAQGDRDRRRRERQQRRAARRPARRKTISMVVAIVIVAVGAVLVAVRTRAIEDESAATLTTAPGPGTRAGTTGTTDRGLNYTRFHAGDCLTWDQKDQNSSVVPVDVLPCDQPHLLEMVSSHVVPERFSTYPDDFKPIFDEVCRTDVEGYLGAPLDPSGRFYVSGLKPTRTGWQAGDRQLLCGVARYPLAAEEFTDTDHGLIAAAGTALGQPQDRLFAEGTCMRRQPWSVVDCSGSHDWEITSTIVLADQATIPAPDDNVGWFALAGDRCRAAAAAYLGHPLGADLWSGYQPIEQASWAVGRRTLQCTVSRADGAPIDAPLRGVTA